MISTRASHSRVEGEHVKGLGLSQEFASERTNRGPDTRLAIFSSQPPPSCLHEESLRYAEACSQSLLLRKKRIDH
jgi:hypothetical protein